MKSYNDDNKIIIKVNIKHIIGLLIIVLLLLGLFYTKIIGRKIGSYKLASQTETFVQNNEEPVFKVSKIVLYSSADAVDNSESQVLQDLDISQYTDMSINIDNKSKTNEITEQNTIKQLYIDNIEVQIDSEKGEKILNYKNPYIFGKFKMLENCGNGRIDFKVINTNQENDAANYDEPTIYADCSNPITLGYINKNIITNYSVSEQKKSVTFDGKMLKNENIDFDDLNCIIRFQIHIINNLNQEFVCPVEIENDLNNGKKEIYKQGYVLKTLNAEEQENKFIQLN